MKERRVKIAILGAGTAGMSAWREVSKVTSDFVLVNGGEYGTTCARVGCMPSKLFIQSANDFHRRHKLSELGILGGADLQVESARVFERVRKYRDRFVSGVLKSIEELGDKNIRGYAQFEEPHVIRVNDSKIIAEKIIVAVGSRPFIPESWKSYQSKILTTDDFFESLELPSSIAVVGAGVIGLELGQAIHRLGAKVGVFGGEKSLAIITDPDIKNYALELFKSEIDLIQLGKFINPEATDSYEKILMAAGRKPNLDLLAIENSGAEMGARGLPKFNPHNMKVEGTNYLYIAGDTNGDRPILHEAADEGRIAGFNACRPSDKEFRRRTPLGIVFTDPNIAVVGQNFDSLKEVDSVVGEVSFEHQGRAVVAAKAKGLLRLYADRKSGKLLGSEMISPNAEHLAHLIAWSIQQGLTAYEMLSMPYYHPVLEEGLRTAVREVTKKTDLKKPDLEIPPCGPLAHECLAED